HAEADAEEGNLVLAGELDGVDHALNAALAEAAGNQDAVVIFEALLRGFKRVDLLGFDPVDDGLVIVRQPAVKEGFAQALVGIFELNVLADNGDADFALGMMKASEHIEPGLHVGGAIFEAE